MNRLPITWPSVVPPAHPDNKNPNEPWDFKEQGRLISAPTKQALIDKIVSFRSANGYEVGDVSLEVERFRAAKTGSPVQVVQAPLKELAKTWLANMAGKIAKSEARFVSDQEAERRAAICRSCPKNQPVPTGCVSCEANQERLVSILTYGKCKPVGLQHCEHFKFVLPLAVHLDKDGHNAELRPSAPPACWNR